MNELSWAALIDTGLTHVEHLSDPDDRHEHWLLTASDGSCLVRVERMRFPGQAATWHAFVYRPTPRPVGGVSTMRNWVFEWERIYDNVPELLGDVAALAG